ncbi:hypothetical protein OTU49_003432 [Cherax quadricarinatus]|uniref:Uncharacterized protein n=1 Tax=Cherax quadricarinatus TaxID=27406 RepID=A0AAW0X5B5_CHEQU
MVTDQLLYTTKGPKPTVLWLPGNGRSIVPDLSSYRPFDRIVRTVHLHEALDICVYHRMIPKHIISLCTLNRKHLKNNHPCKKLRVLWFGAQYPEDDEEEHDWYGNVSFTMPVDLLMEHWRYCFFVEIMTAPTHTTTRLLVTNTDYSSMLIKYDPCTVGGPWYKTSSGHLGLIDCRRYNNIGSNRHGNTLEFMIEVTRYGETKILEKCEISFKNHSKARDKSLSHVCHRFQKPELCCPSPVARAIGSRIFFHEHTNLTKVTSIAKPPLSESAQLYLQCYLTMDGAPSVPRPLPFPAPSVPMYAPHPLINPINQHTQQFVLMFPNGILSVNSLIEERCSLVGQIERTQSSDLRFIPSDFLLALEYIRRQRENGENGNINGQTVQHQLGNLPNQEVNGDARDSQTFSEVLQHTCPGRNGFPQFIRIPPAPIGMFQSHSCQGHTGIFQHSWGPIHPGMLQANLPNHPEIMHHNLDSGHPGRLHHSWG